MLRVVRFRRVLVDIKAKLCPLRHTVCSRRSFCCTTASLAALTSRGTNAEPACVAQHVGHAAPKTGGPHQPARYGRSFHRRSCVEYGGDLCLILLLVQCLCNGCLTTPLRAFYALAIRVLFSLVWVAISATIWMVWGLEHFLLYPLGLCEGPGPRDELR